MLLIGVSGAPGTGKTTLLLRVAEWTSQNNIRISGFVALARGNRALGGGAASYSLRFIDSGDESLLAERNESLSPPYLFSSQAIGLAETSMNAVETAAPRVVIFDEIGRVEAAGQGLANAFAAVISAKPPVVIAAIRDTSVPAVEERFNCRFAMTFRADDPDAFGRICAIIQDHSDWQRVGAYGAGSAAIEMTIGTALHAARVPLRGLLLSTTQSIVMMHASEGLEQRRRVVWVPFIAAGMKALSPAGSRLRPMLAITVQGLLFAGSLSAFGWNIVGVAVGGALVGAWSAAQGVLLQYLFMGGDMVRAYDAAVRWAAARLDVSDPGFLALAVGWTVVCAAFGAVATVAGWTMRHRHAAAVKDALARRASKAMPARPQAHTFRSRVKETARDLARPAFWLPVAIVIALVLVSGSTAESAALIAMRAFAIAFVLYAAARTIDPRRVSAWLHRKGYWGPALAFDEALSKKSSDGRAVSDAVSPPTDRT